jgi:hypothetical protein
VWLGIALRAIPLTIPIRLKKLDLELAFDSGQPLFLGFAILTANEDRGNPCLGLLKIAHRKV